MMVYYFTSEQHALDNIFNERIKISLLHTVNDPFELFARDMSLEKHLEDSHMIKGLMEESHGIICFSKSYKNPLMWGHYSENHKGLCLGFEIQENELKYVEYIQHREVKNDIGLNIKSKDWKYEKEVRLWVKLKAMEHCSPGLYFKKFNEGVKLELKEIILGINSTCNKKIINDALINYNSNVKIIDTKLSKTKFEIVDINDNEVEVGKVISIEDQILNVLYKKAGNNKNKNIQSRDFNELVDEIINCINSID